MACVLKGSHSFTCTPRVHPLTDWTIPAFSFPAEAYTRLPTPKGWKAELTGWLVTYRNNVRHWELNPDMVAHLSTNRARHILTSLIEANALPTMPDQCDQRGEFQPKCSSSSVFWSLTSQMGRLYCWTEVQCSEVTVVEKYKFYVCLILDIWALVFRLVESTSIDYQVCFFWWTGI